jgi:hypothetical protein
MSPPSLVQYSDSAILGRAVDLQNWKLSAEAARAILAIELSPGDQVRMDALAASAQAGTLTADEEIEIENYRRVGCLVELLKSKARLFLKRAGLAP